MRNASYSHEGMLITLQGKAGEMQALTDWLFRLTRSITPGDDNPDAIYKAEELEGNLAALSKQAVELGQRLDALRDYTMYPPSRPQRRVEVDLTEYVPGDDVDADALVIAELKARRTVPISEQKEGAHRG